MLLKLFVAFLGVIVGLAVYVMYFAATVFIAIFAGIWLLAACIGLAAVAVILELRDPLRRRR